MSIQKIDGESKGIKITSVCGLALLSVLAGSGLANATNGINQAASKVGDNTTEKVASNSDSNSGGFYDAGSAKSHSHKDSDKKSDDSKSNKDDKSSKSDNKIDANDLSNKLAGVVKSTINDVKQAASSGSKNIMKDLEDGSTSLMSAFGNNRLGNKSALMSMNDVPANLLHSNGGNSSNSNKQNTNNSNNAIKQAMGIPTAKADNNSSLSNKQVGSVSTTKPTITGGTISKPTDTSNAKPSISGDKITVPTTGTSGSGSTSSTTKPFVLFMNTAFYI